MDHQYLVNIQKKLGKRISKVRIYAGYRTQSDFAEIYSVSGKASWISKVENGEENLSFITMVKFAHKLKVSMRCIADLRNTEPIIIDEAYCMDLDERIAKEKQAFASNLAKIRSRKGLILLDIELASGIDKYNVGKYENGRRFPNFTTMVLLCDAMESPLLDLFPLEEL